MTRADEDERPAAPGERRDGRRRDVGPGGGQARVGQAQGVRPALSLSGAAVHSRADEPVEPCRTITQRFTMPTAVEGETCEVDVDADCRRALASSALSTPPDEHCTDSRSSRRRLCFFVEKKADGGWKNHFFKCVARSSSSPRLDTGAPRLA